MKITKIVIPDFQQFKDFELDLTYPEGHKKAGEPLEKVCFIGPNGTGKSTLLVQLLHFLSNFGNVGPTKIVIKLKAEDHSIYVIKSQILPRRFVHESVENDRNLLQLISKCENKQQFDEKIGENNKLISQNTHKEIKEIEKNHDSDCLIAYSPPESILSSFQEVPQTSLGDAIKRLEKFPKTHHISKQNSVNFWNVLLASIDQRNKEFKIFSDKNESRVYKELKEEFNKENPLLLRELSIIWNKLLEKVGLYFDWEAANVPYHMEDNLTAYIKLKSSGETIPYSSLSTGIQNFIFGIGHIYSLYFNRTIKQGFLLVDEPENSLYPDFLYDLIDIYTSIIHNTQFFVATHSTIIAAQFDPAERVILDFDDNGFVKATRGVSPEGDDANDLLHKDFMVRSILGKVGQERWSRFVKLKSLIRNEKDESKKTKLMDEYLNIRNTYNFPTL